MPLTSDELCEITEENKDTNMVVLNLPKCLPIRCYKTVFVNYRVLEETRDFYHHEYFSLSDAIKDAKESFERLKLTKEN